MARTWAVQGDSVNTSIIHSYSTWSLRSTRFYWTTEQLRKKFFPTADKINEAGASTETTEPAIIARNLDTSKSIAAHSSQKWQSSISGSKDWPAWGGKLHRLFGRHSVERPEHTIHWEPSRIRSSAHNWGIEHMAPGFGRFISCDTSPISISAILGPTLRLNSSQKLATLRHNRNRHRRAQPFGWLYTSTTQCPTSSWALKTIDLSRTT